MARRILSPLTPTMLLATDPSFTLAHSNSRPMRLVMRFRSCTKCVRRRTKSRHRRIRRGGMKLPRNSPYWCNSAIRAASLESVLQPGSAFTSIGFTNKGSSPCFLGSNTFHTGIQYTPVDSMATRRTSCCFSQSRSRSSSSVNVPNVSRVSSTSPSLRASRMHAHTVFLCTSSAATRRYSIFIVVAPSAASRGRLENR